MKQAQTRFSTATRGKGLYNITRDIVSWVREQKIQTGLLTVYIPHTSASLIIQENADPDVLADLNAFFSRLAPDGDELYRHTAEGPDDMPAHVRSALTQTQISIPVASGRPVFGAWQDVYLFEHRNHPHSRSVVLHLCGE